MRQRVRRTGHERDSECDSDSECDGHECDSSEFDMIAASSTANATAIASATGTSIRARVRQRMTSEGIYGSDGRDASEV